MIKAIFIGKDSCGFKYGQKYELKTKCHNVNIRNEPVPCLCVYDRTNERHFCPYTSLESFLSNWKLV